MGKKRVYLAGKITGDDDYFYKFEEAERALIDRGYIVINPALLPSEGFSWESYIRMSTAMLDECDAICFLPDWTDSRGAMYEYGRAVATGKEIMTLDFMIIEGECHGEG